MRRWVCGEQRLAWLATPNKIRTTMWLCTNIVWCHEIHISIKKWKNFVSTSVIIRYNLGLQDHMCPPYKKLMLYRTDSPFNPAPWAHYLSHGDEGGSLLPSWPLPLLKVVIPESNNEGVCGLLEQLYHRVIEGVLVLVQPTHNRVPHLETGETLSI